MYKIQANTSGTRSIEVSEEHLQTIERYALLKNLVDSNGIIDEAVLDKLKLNVRSMLEAEAGKDKDLLDLCLDVIYNSNMKAFGLHKLVLLYVEWAQKKEETQTEETQTEETAQLWATIYFPPGCPPPAKRWTYAVGTKPMSFSFPAMPT